MPGPADPPSGVEDRFLAACSAEDWPRALGLVEQHWTTLVFRHATYRELFAMLAAAPEDLLRRSPRAALNAEIIGRLPRASTPLPLPAGAAQVDRALRSGRARQLLETAVLGMIARRASGLPQEALAIARASRPLLRATALTRFSPAADLAAYWHLQAAQAALHCGDLTQAALELRHAWSFRAQDVTTYVAPSVAPLIALLAAVTGDEPELERWLGEVDALIPESSDLIDAETMRRPALVARLLVASDRLDAGTAAPLAEALHPQLAFDETWPITLFALVRHLVDTGQADRAPALIDGAVELHPSAPRTDSFHADFVVLARAEAALALGRASSLGRLLEGAGPGLATLHAVRRDLAAGDLEAARRLAEGAERTATDARVRREARLLATAARLGLGDAPPDPAGSLPPELPPELRRAAALLPGPLADLLRGRVDDVPPPAMLPSDSVGVVRLTPAETRVLRALDDSAPLPRVADRLHVSRNTLKTQLRGLYAKLGASSRAEALAVARRVGLLGDDEGPPP